MSMWCDANGDFIMNGPYTCIYCFCKSLAWKDCNKSVNLKAVSYYICSGVDGRGGDNSVCFS